MSAPLLALGLYVLGLALAFGVRSIVQWRRTGDTGLRLDAGPAGSIRWWAKLLFIAALLLGLAGPLAALAGLDPIRPLDHGPVRLIGLVLAAAGVTATLLAQLTMGSSWRIGVDPAERTALVTGGAFALVRNPIFTAMTVTSLGLTLMVPNPVSLAATAALIASIQMQVRAVEEPHLAGVHGAAYAGYAARVGRFLPGLGTTRPGEVPVFDHLMHWVPDMAAAVVAYRAAGFPVRPNRPRQETGVQNGGWWKDLHYVEVLAVLDEQRARTTTAYGGFTRMILPAVQQTLAAGGGALNFAAAVDDVPAAVAAMRAAGVAAEQHTVRLTVGPFTIAAFTIGWATDAPPWAPFVIRYHPLLRRIQKLLLPLLARRQPRFDIGELVIEVPDPAASAAWLSTTLGLSRRDGDRASVDLGVCAAVFVPGPADRIATVVLAGPGAPAAVIAGLDYQPQAAAKRPGARP